MVTLERMGISRREECSSGTVKHAKNVAASAPLRADSLTRSSEITDETVVVCCWVEPRFGANLCMPNAGNLLRFFHAPSPCYNNQHTKQNTELAVELSRSPLVSLVTSSHSNSIDIDIDTNVNRWESRGRLDV